MMTEYYFLTSFLPELQIGHVPSLGFQPLMELLAVNLTKKDQEVVKDFLHFIDYENLRAIWAHELLDQRGNFTKEELERAIADNEWPEGQRFPDYLQEFLQKYPTEGERVQNFYLLMSRFFDERIENTTGFLQEFYRFEKQWRIVMVGFRAKRYNKQITEQLRYEDPDDSIVAQVLAQKDTEGFEPPYEFRELKPMFEEYEQNPIELHQAILHYRFRTIVELSDWSIFGIERILGYIARLILVEKWLELDLQKGINIVDQIVGEVK